MQKNGTKDFLNTLGKGILHFLFSLFIFCSSIWLCLAIWYQQPFGSLISRIIILFWIIFALSILGIYITRHLFTRAKDVLIYVWVFILSLVWYFSLEARQDRDWNPEVAQVLHYEKNGDLITLHNVRNFQWQTEEKYKERWESCTFDLNKITGVNVITSYWMGPQIAHTLVSFDFADSKPITFSIETRKEKTEEFSTLGGFFRKYELSLIASDEKDILYTRSNVRKEQVYFFPINMPKEKIKQLFEEYLLTADELQRHAKWYNTLTSNCTTLVFDMVQAISDQKLPMDYRLLASGYLPNYLYDLNALSHNLDMSTWYQRAHVNPKVEHYTHLNSQQYSQLIRQNLPQTQH